MSTERIKQAAKLVFSVELEKNILTKYAHDLFEEKYHELTGWYNGFELLGDGTIMRVKYQFGKHCIDGHFDVEL